MFVQVTAKNVGGVFYETQCIYQTVQFFIQTKTGVWYITIFKYSLRNFNVTTRRMINPLKGSRVR